MKPKILILIALVTFSFQLSTLNCYAQSWQWAKSGGGTTSDDGTDVCQDNNGNIYMTGHYDDSPYATSSGTFDTVTVPYIGASQIFVVKYSSTGDVLWAKSIGGNDPTSSYPEQPIRIIYEPVSNSIYLTGKYNNTMVLGSDTLLGSGFFYTKISTSGNFIWSKKLSNTMAGSLTSDNEGNIYIGGGCNAATTFDTVPVQPNYFIAKFNSSGICLKVNSNIKFCNPSYLAFRNGKLLLTGMTLNDTIQMDTLTKTFSNPYNLYVARFDQSLHLKWVKFATSNNQARPLDICLDSLCNSYIVGYFKTNLNFVSVNLTITSGPQDFFIAKYDSSGIFQWANQGYNTTGFIDYAFCKPLKNGDFYIAGSYNGTDLHLGTNTISLVNAFIARYNNSGNCLSVVTIPGSGYCQGLTVDASDNFSIIGYFLSTLAIGSYSVTSHGFGDVYIAKHDALTHVGLKILNANNQLVIYANPNAGKCTITIPDEFKTETKLTLQIFDNKGILLQQTPVEMMQDKISVNITAEAKGIYTAVLSNGVKSYTGKIIFE